MSFINTGIGKVSVLKEHKLKNYPNPFGSTTTFYYEIPKADFVTITVYNTVGQIVTSLVNEERGAGNHTVQWNAANVEPGVYFYKIVAGEYSTSTKCEVLK